MNHLETLTANVASLPAQDQNFAGSLLVAAARGSLSDKQAHWVKVLAERAETGDPPAGPALVLHGIVQALTRAHEAIKRPKLRLVTPEGSAVVLSIAGPAARYPGSVNVTDGRPYGSSVFYGRIALDGEFENRAAPADVLAALERAETDPAATVQEYGRITGQCSCCGRTLTDPNSIEAGIGPICAGRFGF